MHGWVAGPCEDAHGRSTDGAVESTHGETDGVLFVDCVKILVICFVDSEVRIQGLGQIQINVHTDNLYNSMC